MILTFEKKSHGKAKGLFKKKKTKNKKQKHMVRQKVRAQFLLSQKNHMVRKKGKNLILTFEKKITW